MSPKRLLGWLTVVSALAVWPGLLQAEMVIDWVTVGNPRNGGPGDLGSADYVYRMGKYEITARQYVEFLNAAAATDTYGLYTPDMYWGCGIERAGTAGDYQYTVAPDYADRPVNYVSFWDACRLANWMHNGQPTGPQDATTTEDGAYTLNGVTGPGGFWMVRNHGARYFVPTISEWQKAAYHRNDGVTGNYWLYPTGSDSLPSNTLIEPDPGNRANYVWYSEGDVPHYTLGGPYWTTEVGEFENSASPYGTFDQGGNVAEWTDAIGLDGRIMRGGSYEFEAYQMESGFMMISDTEDSQSHHVGCRLASRQPDTPVLPVLFDNGRPPGSSFAEMPQTVWAEDFVVSRNCKLIGMTLWTHVAMEWQWPEEFHYFFFADDEGVPAEVAFASGVGGNAAETIRTVMPMRLSEWYFEFESPVALRAGQTYWLGLHTPRLGDSLLMWQTTGMGFGSHAVWASVPEDFQGHVENWNVSASQDLAFYLVGVPEPSSALTGTIAAVALIAYFCRRATLPRRPD